MDLALHNIHRLICYKTQIANQQLKIIKSYNCVQAKENDWIEIFLKPYDSV